ncbi:MAG: hypothetical protein PHU85_05820 [Phycisphaerae bacterium]|nr:hypothetical protein [Phycisphaerae bacterium]
MSYPRLYQLACVLAAAAVLLAVGAPMQAKLSAARSAAMPAHSLADSGELDSFAMSLMLGGFRGPLVMYLWVTSEDEKNNEDTERFLTRANLIGDLQPEFSAIYTHQSWNLAYNVSVQYTRETEKYRWVMKGIEFAEKGDYRLPDNTDVLSQTGHLYFDKIGQSYEGDYYRTRFRHDSLDRLLDKDRRLKPAADPDNGIFVAPMAHWKFIDRLDGLLAVIARNQARRDASPMPDRPPDAADFKPLDIDPLAARHVWPYGVSPFAIAFDYFQQATTTGKHSQFGPSVVSSRPALAGREWLKEELLLAMSAESRLWPMDQLGQPLPVPAADLSPDHAALVEAVYHTQEALRVTQLARACYQSHLSRYRGEGDIYVAHFNDIALKQSMAEAGLRRLTGLRDWLRASQTHDAALLGSARQKLAEARAGYATANELIRSYMLTEYRLDPWNTDDRAGNRAPFELLANQAQRAGDQIDRMLSVK